MKLDEITISQPDENGNKNSWRRDESAYFEYHCYQGHDSSDAEAWYRSHQPVTVLKISWRGGSGKTLRNRINNGDPRSYRVKWADGFEYDVFEDELYADASHFSSTCNPPNEQEIADARKKKNANDKVTKLDELQLKKDLIAAEDPVPGEGFKPGDQVKGLFGKYGWNLLGHGIEGAVADHPTNGQVLKLFINDSPYKDFVKIVKDNPNPHFPKFSKYFKDVPGTKWSYVLMEKMQPISSPDYLIDNFLSYMYVMEVESERMKVVGLPGKFGSMVLDYVYDTVEQFGDNPYTSMVWNKLGAEQPDPKWFLACRMLCHYAKRRGWRQLDLHPGNFMLRGDTLVINDPFGPLA